MLSLTGISFIKLISYLLLNHLKMPQSILYRLNLFLRTSRLSAILRFWLIVIFTLNNPMFLFYLSNVQICYMKSIVLLHPFLDFFVCSFCFCTCSIYLIQFNLYLDIIVRLLLGQKNNSLNMARLLQIDVKNPPD